MIKEFRINSPAEFMLTVTTHAQEFVQGAHFVALCSGWPPPFSRTHPAPESRCAAQVTSAKPVPHSCGIVHRQREVTMAASCSRGIPGKKRQYSRRFRLLLFLGWRGESVCVCGSGQTINSQSTKPYEAPKLKNLKTSTPKTLKHPPNPKDPTP